MPIKSFRDVPANPFEWARFFEQTEVSPNPGTVTDDAFADREANSILGRAANSAGPPADIVALSDGYFLVRRSGALQFDGLTDADIPSGIARDTEVSSAIASAIATHEAASDPHPGYLTQTEGDARYALLETTGTYTGAFNGTTTDPAPMLRWSKTGKLVALYIPQTSATSNATTFAIAGAPAGIRPTRAQTLVAIVRDNGTVAYGTASMGTDGTLTLGLGAASGAFTNIGTKGVELQTLMYSLD